MIDNMPVIYFTPTLHNEIEEINTWLLMHNFCTLPQEYQKFLLSTNGLSCNGLDLYGSCAHYRETKNYKFPSIKDINQNFINYSFFKDKVILGNWNESLIYYDKRGNYYALADRINLRSRYEADSFEKILNYLMDAIIS